MRSRLDDATKHALVEALRHERIPCPARGLELVVYTEEAVRTASPDPGYELDLNTGETMPFRASFDDADADRHWYVIDRAIAREHGIALHGRRARRLFAEIPRAVLIDALAASIEWHREAGQREQENASRNAARAVRFAEQGIWSSKNAATQWVDADITGDDFLAEALARVRAAGDGGL